MNTIQGAYLHDHDNFKSLSEFHRAEFFSSPMEPLAL
jgi:hypothetical protein